MIFWFYKMIFLILYVLYFYLNLILIFRHHFPFEAFFVFTQWFTSSDI